MAHLTPLPHSSPKMLVAMHVCALNAGVLFLLVFFFFFPFSWMESNRDRMKPIRKKGKVFIQAKSKNCARKKK